jgi:mannose/fructose/N-acetylgalactosamine-specific phosphotransferase system component IIB
MPGSETLLVMSVSEFVRWMATTEESWRVFLLLKTPETASHLLEAGLEMDSLNVGAMGARPDTERVYKSVSLTQEQLALLRSLETRGVNVFFQTVPEPEGKPTPLRTVAGQR